VDSDTETWDLFGNHFWPSTYLFDSSGELVYQHFGEGGYIETQQAVRNALDDAGRDISRVKPLMDEGSVLAAGAHTITREISMVCSQFRVGTMTHPARLFCMRIWVFAGTDSLSFTVFGGTRNMA